MTVLDPLSAGFGRLARQVAGPMVGSAIVVYFAFYGIEGERGFYALKHLENEVGVAKSVLAQVHAERERMDRRAKLLRPDSLDLDMLDERARTMLNYSRPDEVVIFFPSTEGNRQTIATATPVVAR